MKKIEIKKLGPASVFKVIIYMMIIPVALCIFIGFIMALIGAAAGKPEFLGIGIAVIIIYPVMLIGVYGGFSVLMALIYNLLAGKFGGLELTVKEDEPKSQSQFDERLI